MESQVASIIFTISLGLCLGGIGYVAHNITRAYRHGAEMSLMFNSLFVAASVAATVLSGTEVFGRQ